LRDKCNPETFCGFRVLIYFPTQKENILLVIFQKIRVCALQKASLFSAAPSSQHMFHACLTSNRRVVSEMGF